MARCLSLAYHTRMDDFVETFLLGKREMTSRDWLIDAGIALVAFAFGCGQLVLSSAFTTPDELFRQLLGMPESASRSAPYFALAFVTLPLVLRRKLPWPTFLFVLIAFLLTQRELSVYALAALGPTISVYTIARERMSAEAVAAAVIAVFAVLMSSTSVESANLSFVLRLQNVAFMVAAAFAGYAVRTHQEYVMETERRAIAAEKSREDEAARRVEEERVRIAREIHDITAHSLSAVSIQAAAAQRMIDKDPETAKEAIATVRSTAKDALEEIRSMIGVLRSGDAQAHAETAPTAGTDRMKDIISYLEHAGLKVQFDCSHYDRSCVPAYVDVALYGIAREAATNIVRHAQAQHVNILLSKGETFVQLVVEDDGRGAPDADTAGVGDAGAGAGVAVAGAADGAVVGVAAADGAGVAVAATGAIDAAAATGTAAAAAESAASLPQTASAGGHGIKGMKERVSLLDGKIIAGNREGGGFVVKVSVPLSENGRKHG